MKKIICKVVGSEKKVILGSCRFYEGNLIKVIGMGVSVVEVIDLKKRRFEAAVRYFKKPSICKNEEESIPGTCFHKDKFGESCDSYFCEKYEGEPVTKKPTVSKKLT
jgi:hypothetical protein